MSTESVELLKQRIAKLEEENRKWMRLAGMNRLTQLPNGLMLFQVVLPKELNKGGEQSLETACIFLCPDGFGEINQQHGRVIGDKLLQHIGQFLKNQLEKGELLFHCDGANFALLVPGKGEGYAKRRATTIKNIFREQDFVVGEASIGRLSCSAGTASIAGERKDIKVSEAVDRLYHDLCDRLYQAKASGGNYVVGAPRHLN
ncbi:MAG: diguanylate cyclase (GGDEF)-like protein [Candidatus Latescibacterota bacterium]|jgi:diguanylate cyclase (GGDEF)-like protein